MSSNLYWRPYSNQGEPITQELKIILNRHFQHLGGLDSRLLTISDTSYLEGIVDGSSNENTKASARALLKAIETYQKIELVERS